MKDEDINPHMRPIFPLPSFRLFILPPSAFILSRSAFLLPPSAFILPA